MVTILGTFLLTAILALIYNPLLLLIHCIVVGLIIGVLGWLFWHHRHDHIGPFLSWNADPRESVSIRWISPTPCSHKIIVRPVPQGAPLTAVQPTPVTHHIADLRGLAPNTSYCYEIWENEFKAFGGKTFCF